MGGSDSNKDKGPDDALGVLLSEGLAATAELEPTPPLQVAQKEAYEVSLRPKAALATFPYSVELAIVQLRRELEAGRVTAISAEGIWRNGDDAGSAPYLIVPRWAWPPREFKLEDDFWDTGYLERSFPKSHPSLISALSIRDGIQFFDVRFHPSGLSAPEPPTVERASASIDEGVFTPSKGGRPPKPWWDDLWVEINRQIYVGELRPDVQANIERAMLDWSVAHGKKLSEASARVAARKLFQALNREDKN